MIFENRSEKKTLSNSSESKIHSQDENLNFLNVKLKYSNIISILTLII